MSLLSEIEKTYVFANKPVLLRRDEDYVQFPCIGLYRKDGMIPVGCPSIAKEFSLQNIGYIAPCKIYKHESKIKRWWQCASCGHEWFGAVTARNVDSVGCEKCHLRLEYDL